MIPSEFSSLAVALQSKFSLSSKFSRNVWEYVKDFYACFVELEKAQYGILTAAGYWC